jgi:hypothetical protein
MLPRNLRQEMLSWAYVRAVAARAGVNTSAPDLDFGFDMLLRGLESDALGVRDSGPQIDVQLKSTTQAEVREQTVVYDLEARAYRLLREPKVARMRLFVLMVLPDDEQLWLNQTESELLLRRCAYWLSLRGAPDTASGRSVRLFIPRANVFDAPALQRLMEEAKKREES